MSIRTLLSELWRFLKDNKLRIFLGGCLFALLAVGVRYGLDHWVLAKDQAAYEYLSQTYAGEPAEFQGIVTIEDGSIMNNSYIYDEYFSSPQVITKVEEETGVDLKRFQESETLLELYKSNQFRGGIAAIRDQSSNVITFRFLVSPNEEDNLKVAQAYYNLLQSEEVAFMDKQEITLLDQPQLGEMLDLERFKEIPTEESLSPYGQTSTVMFIVYGLAGFLVGLMLSLVFLFIRQLIKPTIDYAFDYAWDYDDKHILVRNQDGKLDQRLPGLMSVPLGQKRLVVSQGSGQHRVVEHIQSINEDTLMVNDLALDNPELASIDEIVILVQSYLTQKAWYRHQVELAHLYGKPIRIIHLV